MSDVTQKDREAADAIAEAIRSVQVAYSHDTDNELRTLNRKWFVHEACEGNPFERNEWIEIFDSKEAANLLARKMREERAHIAANKFRIAAEKAVLDRLRNLPDDVASRIAKTMFHDSVSSVNGGWGAYARRIATNIADALEAKR